MLKQGGFLRQHTQGNAKSINETKAKKLLLLSGVGVVCV
jgi:hypothetical protein